MTNFDIFLSEPKFASFAEVAVSVEKILHIDPAAPVLNCRAGDMLWRMCCTVFGQQLRGKSHNL